MTYLNRLTRRIFLGFYAVSVMWACSAPQKKAEETSSEAVSEAKPITLTKAMTDSAEFADAALSLKSMNVEAGDSNFTASFDFTIENYELGAQTPGAEALGIANSEKGQHIHFIVNNGPYSAHYDSTFEKEMEEGQYVLLAFLSRSYHESVKNPDAFWIDVVTVGEPAEAIDIDPMAPHLFYSRPKGTYKGADTEKLLLDFYLLNTTLSPDGNKVKATVNGEEFMIDEWAPYYIENLPKGEITVKLDLVDVNGQLIPGPFNSVERKVMLEE